MPPTSFPLNQFLHSQLWFSTFSQTGLENWANDNLMIPNSAKTLSSHDNQRFSVDGKATRKKVKLCYRKWLSYVIVTMIWNICPGVSWSVAYRYSVGLSTHSRIRVRGSRNCRRYCTVQLIVQGGGDVCESSWEFYVADCFRCVVQCCNKMTHLSHNPGHPVCSTLGRALHFRVNTDAGDWEH